MSCKQCEERRKKAREAFLKSNYLGSAKHVAKGAAEMVGIKKKSAIEESKAKTRTPKRASKETQS